VTFFDQEHQDRRITFYHFLSYTTNKLFFLQKNFFFSFWNDEERERERERNKESFFTPFYLFWVCDRIGLTLALVLVNRGCSHSSMFSVSLCFA
jgi:hypothetical protein